MPVEVILPKVDMDMSHGTIATWHVSEGEFVAQGAALFDIETDKAAMEVEAPASGRLHYIAAAPGARMPVGATLAWLYAEGEEVGPPPKAAVPGKAQPEAAAEAPAPFLLRDAAPSAGKPRATPAARSTARREGIPLDSVPGTGPRGRIQKGDVAHHLEARAEPLPASWTSEPGILQITRRAGEGAPLLLLHGFASDSTSWAPFEKALGPGRALLRLDLPGHGGSPRRAVKNFADLARQIVEAFDALPETGPLHLLGHSLGGALALALADIRPRRIASLALLAPAGLGPEIDAAALAGIARASRAESLAPWLRRLAARPEAITDEYARAAMRPRADPALRACQQAMAVALFPDGTQAFDLRPALSRLACPAALLWGRQDRILPSSQALSAEGDFALHLLANAGHIPQIECPERVAAIAARLVRSAES
jgi:pyruvate dehydrogenase E2 component (dihydrolipoamide acetyltransferase)